MDCFALLGEPRRPWLNPELLKARFLELSARFHPDKIQAANDAEKAAASRRYAELNAAFQKLLEPKDRLRHLFELESGAPLTDVRNIPPGAMELLVEIGQTCRETDQFLTARSNAASPLLKAQMFATGLAFVDRLTALGRRLETRREELLAELKTMNAAWDAAPASGAAGRAAALPLGRLEEACRAFSYLARWTGQIQERLAQLSF